MSKQNRKYVQLNLDLSKEYEKQYADFLDELDKQGIKNKKALMLALDSLMGADKTDKLKDVIRETIEEENKNIIEEIKDLKLMIKAMAGNSEIVITKTETANNIIEVDDSDIDPSELNSF